MTAVPPATLTEPIPAGQPAAEATGVGEPEKEPPRQEGLEERLATARVHQKAYARTATVIRSKLETERNPFRREVYQRMLKDTFALREANRRLLDQLEGKPQAGEGKIVPAKPERRSP